MLDLHEQKVDYEGCRVFKEGHSEAAKKDNEQGRIPKRVEYES